MANWAKATVFGLFIAIVAHIGAIMAMPHVIMSIALKRIAQTAGGINTLYQGQMVTPQNQAIVRSSPDLAYSTCVLDLRDGPVRIFIGKGADYASAALYSSNTDNVFRLNDRSMGKAGGRILVVAEGMKAQPEQGELVVTLPSTRGLMLVRRLAPSSAAVARVNQERANDTCAAVALPPE